MDIFALSQKNPSIQQSRAMYGIYKGVVVDVKDPFMLGRVKVYSYPLHGDAENLSVENLPWCEFIQPTKGHHPPELGDRVALGFESGDKYAPIVVGYWRATPMGRGKLPWSSKVGSDVPVEAWISRGLYPEATVIARSGAGNCFWFEDKKLGENIFSSINMEDTGGKLFRARSFHVGQKPYAPVDEMEGKKGGLKDYSEDAPKPIRDGLSPAPLAAGVVELATHNTVRSLRTSAEDYSADEMIQASPEGGVGITQESVSGMVHRTRQGIASLNLSDDVMTLMGKHIMAMPFHTTPRIW